MALGAQGRGTEQRSPGGLGRPCSAHASGVHLLWQVASLTPEVDRQKLLLAPSAPEAPRPCAAGPPPLAPWLRASIPLLHGACVGTMARLILMTEFLGEARKRLEVAMAMRVAGIDPADGGGSDDS